MALFGQKKGQILIVSDLCFASGGAEGARTLDPHNAIVVLSQLSYNPTICVRDLFRTQSIISYLFKECYKKSLSQVKMLAFIS